MCQRTVQNTLTQFIRLFIKPLNLLSEKRFLHVPTNTPLLRQNQVHSASVNNKFLSGNNFENKIINVFNKWVKVLEDKDISEPRESIEHIIAHFLGSKKISDVYKYQEKILSIEEMKVIDNMCEMRLKRLPVQYIIGEWDFRDLTLKMLPPVFIPRPETETLVDLVLQEVDAKKCNHVLEFCCGSGAICLSLLKARPKINVTAVEQSKNACNLTKENAEKYKLSKRLSIIQSKITESNQLNFISDRFKIIVSNPPYVPSRDMENIQPEIALYEDLEALDGGEDGLKIIRLILNVSSRILINGGVLMLEVDPSHPEILADFLNKNPQLLLRLENTFKDFCNKNRFVKIIKL